MHIKKIIILLVLVFGTSNFRCATVPPEFITAMETERNGIDFLMKRHRQTVHELVENWYAERLARLVPLKEQELKKITMILPNPVGGEDLVVIERESLLKIEKQFDEAIILINRARLAMIESYLDSENWDKLVNIHNLTLDMSKSLLELNKAQRKFYSSIVGKNIPFPTDFINEKTKELLKKAGIN